MIKRNKGILILTTIITLLPLLVGLLLWNVLPEEIPTHWNAEGEIDGWSSKPFAVFGLPLFLTALHWLCTLGTAADPKSKNQGGKILTLVLWICPMVSMSMLWLIYPAALGYEHILDIPVFMCLLFGVMFIFIGNYLPKCKQNYTIGIKLPWTLDSEENWNKTHRFGGWLWTIGGIVIMVTSFLGNFWLFFVITLIMAFAPMLYSYLYYRKHKKHN